MVTVSPHDALILALAACLSSVAALVKAFANSGRMDRQGKAISTLNNGGGRAIVEGILREHRLIDAPGQTPSSVKPAPKAIDEEGTSTE